MIVGDDKIRARESGGECGLQSRTDRRIRVWVFEVGSQRPTLQLSPAVDPVAESTAGCLL